MTPDEALDRIAARGDPAHAREMEAYHKVARPYLGTRLPEVNELATEWRQSLPIGTRLALAEGLWATNVWEARIAAAKILTQARIRPDAEVWRMVSGWVPEFDSWAIADHASKAGERRLTADPARLDEVEGWVASPHMWSRRAALVMTLPWTKQNHPDASDEAIRDRILGWAADLTRDRDWFIQKAVGWWLRELGKHAPDRVRAFLDLHAGRMRGFAQKEAAKYLG